MNCLRLWRLLEILCILSLIYRRQSLNKHSSKKLSSKPCHHCSKVRVLLPSTHPLHPINTDNACHSCITAAAGTCICHGFSLNLITLFSFTIKLYNYHSLHHFHQFAESCFRTLFNIPHCCLLGKVVLIPYVADSSLKSTRDSWLTNCNYLVPYVIILMCAKKTLHF